MNDNRLTVKPNVIVLELGSTTVKIPMNTFKVFAEWYLTEQEIS